MKSNKGFTLIELIVCIAILGVLVLGVVGVIVVGAVTVGGKGTNTEIVVDTVRVNDKYIESGALGDKNFIRTSDTVYKTNTAVFRAVDTGSVYEINIEKKEILFIDKEPTVILANKLVQ